MNKQDEKRVRAIVKEELQKHLNMETQIALTVRKILNSSRYSESKT